MPALAKQVPVPSLLKVVRTDPPNGAVVTFQGDTWPNHTAGLDYSCRYDAAADVIRFEVQPGDRAYFDSNTRDRAELSGQNLVVDFDRDVWQEYWLWIEADAQTPGPGGQQPILGQWHDTGDATDAGGMPPPIAIIWTGTKLRWQYVWSMSDPFVAGSFTAASIDLGSTTLGRWHQIVQRIKFAKAIDGSSAEVWMDGVKYVTYNGKLSTPNVVGCYPKFGIYRNSDTMPLAVRYMWRKPQYASLASRIGASPPRWRC